MPSDPYLHQLMTLPAALAAYLSPDGLWVALTWQRVHENADVFLLPSDGSTLPVALSHTPERTEFVGARRSQGRRTCPPVPHSG
jgi:hypothetical protein